MRTIMKTDEATVLVRLEYGLLASTYIIGFYLILYGPEKKDFFLGDLVRRIR